MKLALPVLHISFCSCIIVESFQHHDEDGSGEKHGGHVAVEIEDSGSTRHYKEKRGGHVSVEIEDSGSTRHHEVGVTSSARQMGSDSSSLMLRREVTSHASLRDDLREELEHHPEEGDSGVLIEQTLMGKASWGSWRRRRSRALACLWSQWSGWDPPTCPKPCGTGVQKKTRTKSQLADPGGRECDDPNLNVMTVPCNMFSCPINCQWMGWMSWTPCTATCGGGTIQRVRDKSATKEFGGAECPGSALETKACAETPCPIDCEVNEWAEWGNCTEDCGGGERTREKSILVPMQHGGAECPAIEENGTCNEDVCPIKAGTRRLSEISTVAAFFLILVTMRMTPSSQD